MEQGSTEKAAEKPSKPALEISADMKKFVAEFVGKPEALHKVLQKYGKDHPELWDENAEAYTLTFVRDLKNPKVVAARAIDGESCYAMAAEEFPDNPEEHTLLSFKVCWKDGQLVRLAELTYGQEL